MLRIALVITELDFGGAERQLTALATGIDRRFFKPRVYALGSPPPSGKDELVQRLAAAEVPVEFFHARKWWQFGPTADKLAVSLREFQPQVMQSFLFHANVVGALAARQAGLKHISLGVRVNDPRWWRAVLERRSARQASRVVSVSYSVAQTVKRRLRLHDEQSIVIPNGVDVGQFEGAPPASLEEFGVPTGVKPIAFIGRLDRQKGIDRLLALAPAIAQLGAHLLIVGSGPAEARLRAQALRSPAAAHMHFAGWQPNIASMLRASSLLVLPSRYEGMPNVVLEAMAAGLPVLATPADGVREILGEKLAEEQVAEFDISAWKTAIERLLTSSQSDLGERNQQRVLEHFSLPAMVAQYERLFSSLAAQR